MINYLLLYNLPGVLKTTLWMSSALDCCYFILLTLPHCIKLWRSTSTSVAIHCTFPCWGAIGHAIQGLGPIKFVGLFLPNLCKTSSPMNNPVVNAEKGGWGMQGSFACLQIMFPSYFSLFASLRFVAPWQMLWCAVSVIWYCLQRKQSALVKLLLKIRISFMKGIRGLAQPMSTRTAWDVGSPTGYVLSLMFRDAIPP